MAEHVTADFVKVGYIVTVNEQEARRGIDLAFEQFPALLFNLRVEFCTDILLNQGLLLQQDRGSMACRGSTKAFATTMNPVGVRALLLL